MREILFRGIDAVTGKWVQGDLLHISSGFIIYHGSQTESEIKENAGAAIELFIDEVSVVKPKTVGQLRYTNKHGRYFDGDIYYHAGLGLETVSDLCEIQNSLLYGSEEDICEIKGNIHDNPELLK